MSYESERKRLLEGKLYCPFKILDDTWNDVHLAQKEFNESEFWHDNVMLGPNCNILAASHPTDAVIRRQSLVYALPITIGNDVWIGGNVTINQGVTIGDEVIIGSGSVVTKDIPSRTIAAGNPCKVIREITDEDRRYWEDRLKEYEDYCKEETDGKESLH